jgi:hypothetical protein
MLVRWKSFTSFFLNSSYFPFKDCLLFLLNFPENTLVFITVQFLLVICSSLKVYVIVTIDDLKYFVL